jgi:hypothetical protein
VELVSSWVPLPDVLNVDAFLAWDAPMGSVWQLVDRTPHAVGPARLTHEAIQAKAGALIVNHLTASNSVCFVVTAPDVVPRVQSDINMRMSDLAVTCSPNLPIDKSLCDPLLVIKNRAETWMLCG